MIKIDNDFIELNKCLVYSIVCKYATKDNFDDLYQVGWETILEVSQKYDSSLNIKFSTFAYKHILGAILKYVREDKNIRPSRDIIRNNKKIQDYKNEMYILNGKYPSSYEISKKLDIEEYKINDIENSCSWVESLDSIVSFDENEIELIDIISKKESIEKDDLISLKDSLNSLTEEEREFIYQRYYQDKTQTQIAKEQNINQVKVYRYERNILDKLKCGLIS